MDFYYLASPYSKYPAGREEAFKLACRAAALLIKAGVKVFCPIAHTHPIAEHGGMDPTAGPEVWLPADQPFIDQAKGIIVLMADSVKDSFGVSYEVGQFWLKGKPIIQMIEGVVPKEFAQ